MRTDLPRLLVFAILIGLLSCSREHAAPERKPEPPPVRVAVATATRASRPVFEQVVGTVTARTKPVVSAKVGGTITLLGADVGDRVTVGQLLAEVEAREIQARLDQALPQLERARQDAARYRELLATNAVSKQQYDEALARVQTMEATVEEARTLLGYTKVYSPIEGIVRARRVDVGDLASTGRPLFELEGLEGFRFDASVPESLTGMIRRGDRAPIRIDALGFDVDGILAEITPTADPLSRTFLARYDLDTSASLVSGQFGRLMLRVGESDELTIPRAALVQRGQLEIVFVVEGDRAALRIVKAGRIEKQTVTVLSGLADGETVVSRGADLLQDDQRVEIER